MGEPAPEIVFVPRYVQPTWSARLSPVFLVPIGTLLAFFAVRNPYAWKNWIGLVSLGVVAGTVLHSRLTLSRRILFGSQLVIESRLGSTRVRYEDVWLVDSNRIGVLKKDFWFGEMENRDEFRKALDHARSRGWLAPGQIGADLGGAFPSAEEMEADTTGEEARFWRLARPAFACFVPSFTLAFVLLSSGVAPRVRSIPPSLQLVLLTLFFVWLGAETLYRLKLSEERLTRVGKWSSWAALIVLLAVLALRIRR